MALPTNILLTLVKANFFCGRENIVLDEYDAVQKSVVIERNIFSVIQVVFADGPFGPTECPRFSDDFVQDEGGLCWFAQTLLSIHVN